MLIDVFNQVEERGMRKGLEKGIKKGIEKERKRAKKAIVINMLKSNYSDKEIKKISEVTDSELKDIKRQIENE